jgi:hypothetical protein
MNASPVRRRCTLFALVVLTGCDAGQKRPATDRAAVTQGPRAGATASAPAPPIERDTSIVQQRADWTEFRAALPRDAAAAAAALEGYRRLHGLPLDFTLDDKAPDSVKRVLGLAEFEDEMGCGTPVTAHVRSLGTRHPLLITSRVIEFDSTGRTLREWPVPDAPRVGDVIAGVSGEELVTRYDPAPDGVYLRLRPTGEFRISAERLEPLSAQLRVRLDDSGRAQPIPFAHTPENVPCPAVSTYDGMHCLAFPDAGRRRRIAVPIPC